MKLNKVQTKDVKFTRIYNEILQDKKMSWKARGIFCYLWSLPDDWNYRERNIAKNATDGINSLISGIKELENDHYLIIKRSGDGHTAWYLSDHKLDPRHENHDKENPHHENPYKENHDVLQTTNNNKQLSKQTTNVTNKKLCSKIAKDLEVLMVQINGFVLEDINDMIKTYPSKLIFKAIHIVATRNPNPKYVINDVWTQLRNGCQTNHQPKKYSNSKYHPIKEGIPKWTKENDKELNPTSSALDKEIKQRLHRMNDYDKKHRIN